jgi:hypothetical protein
VLKLYHKYIITRSQAKILAYSHIIYFILDCLRFSKIKLDKIRLNRLKLFFLIFWEIFKEDSFVLKISLDIAIMGRVPMEKYFYFYFLSDKIIFISLFILFLILFLITLLLGSYSSSYNLLTLTCCHSFTHSHSILSNTIV